MGVDRINHKRKYARKSFILIFLVIFMILTLSVSFAADNDTDNDVTITKNEDMSYVGASQSPKTNDETFTKLSNEINKSSNSLVLNKNYKYSSSDSPNGIIIEKNNLVIDGKGHSINANGNSRIFDIYGTNVVLQNMVLVNSNHFGGSAIYVNPQSSVKTINVTFQDCVSKSSGVVYVEGATYTSSSDKFVNCKAAENGVITSAESNININNGFMKTKHKLNKGFVTSIEDSSITVTNTVFTDSTSKYSTAIFADSALTVQNCKFINLESELTAGAIALRDVKKSYTITNSIFNNVTSGRNGGAIFVDIDAASKNNGYGTIKSSNFTDCRAGFGGAVLQLGGQLTIDGCNFIDNRAVYDGGAVYTSYTNLDIKNSNFNSNKNLLKMFNGAAVYFDEGVLSIAKNTFTANTGGESAIYVYDSKYQINNNVFKSNQDAITAFFSKGNADNNKLNGDKLSLDNSDFSSYVAEEGVELINKNPVPSTAKLPASYDYRKLGYITSVKNQGNKNSCWAFAINTAAESSILKATGKKYDLSENIVFNSMLKYSRVGALDTSELAVFTRPTGGLLSWLGTTPQEYDTYDELGKITEFYSAEESIHIQDMMYLDAPKTVNNIRPFKEALYKYGGIAVVVNAEYNDPKIYNKPTAASYSNKYVDPNHFVTIVGWDDNYSKNNFATKPAGDGAWIVQNSYGTDWGDKGYYYISYYDKILLENNGIVFIINNTLNYNKNYQTDIIGNDENYFRPNTGNTIYYVNKYNMLEDDYLAAVGTYFDQEGVNYEVEIYVNEKLLHSQKGTSPFHGFTTIKLKNYIPVKEDDLVEVLVKSNAAPVQIESRQYAQKGVSLYSLDKNYWVDPSGQDQTICLKLYTVDKSSIETSNKKSKVGYSVTLYDKYGNTLKDQDVSITINNQKYNVKTNKAGVATINTQFKNEKYEIEIFNPDTEETYLDYLSFDESNTGKNDNTQTNQYKNKGVKASKTESKTFKNTQTVKHNFLTLERLNNIFNQNFTNGHLLVWIDGELVFNATTTDNLEQIIYDLLRLLSGNHELKVEFTDSSEKTSNYTENITV